MISTTNIKAEIKNQLNEMRDIAQRQRDWLQEDIDSPSGAGLQLDGSDTSDRGSVIADELYAEKLEARKNKRLQKLIQKLYNPRLRFTAAITAVVFLIQNLAPGAALMAQEIPEFAKYDSQELKSYFNRAEKFNDKEAYDNYVQLGRATELADWEQEAIDELQESIDSILSTNKTEAQKKAQLQTARDMYAAARQAWEEAAQDEIDKKRGLYLADQIQLAEVDRPGLERDIEAILAKARDAVSKAPELELDGFDAVVDPRTKTLRDAFLDELARQVQTAKDAQVKLPAKQLEAFKKAIDERDAQIRQEYELMENFYVLRGRNQYVAELRADDMSARVIADAKKATSQTETIIARTEKELARTTDNMLAAANQGIKGVSDGADQSDIGVQQTGNWEDQMEAIIDRGLRRWGQAEEELYKKHLEWQQTNKKNRARGKQHWDRAHARMKTARDQWLADLQTKMKAGRKQWDQKFKEFRQRRKAAEAELAAYIKAERERRDATLAQMGEMVRGGGAALGEAKDAYYYYDALAKSVAAGSLENEREKKLHAFYVEQRDMMQTAVRKFVTLLGRTEGTLTRVMNSRDNDTGFLRDVRAFAGTLPEDIKAIDASNFENELKSMMVNPRFEENFVLYKRDLEALIDRNSLYTQRARELKVLPGFNYGNANTIDELSALVIGLDAKYSDHAGEMAEIIARKRAGLTDKAARLAAVKADIKTYFTESVQTNARLKKQTIAYFTGGLGFGKKPRGYHLTSNQNDPYLMTKAEFEWELLRRERNYLAERLARAEQVKRYADLAKNHAAGLEIASITRERAEVAHIRSKLREIQYQLIKGDITYNKQAASDAGIRTAEARRMIAERGIDMTEIDARETILKAEQAIIKDLAGQGLPDAATIAGYQQRISVFLKTHVPDEKARAHHRLQGVLDKLAAQQKKLGDGATIGEQTLRWKIVTSSNVVLRQEINALLAEYDFAGLRAEVTKIETQLTRRQVPDWQQDLAEIKKTLKTNARALRKASEQLQLAKKAYKQARIDFEIINSGANDDLIKIEITNATRGLATVLNRMTKIEDIPGFDKDKLNNWRLYDRVAAGRIRMMHTVSENARIKEELRYSKDVLSDVQGLEEAKRRKAAMQEVLDAASTKTARQIAADLKARKSDIIQKTALDARLKSHPLAIQGYDRLQQAVLDLEKKETERNKARQARTKRIAKKTRITARAELIEVNQIAQKEGELALLRRKLERRLEEFTAAVRGEEQARRAIVLDLLGQAGPDHKQIRKAVQTDTKTAKDRSFDRAVRTAAHIKTFFTENREKSFVELEAILRARLNKRSLHLNLQGRTLENLETHNAASEIALKDEMLYSYLIRHRLQIEHNNRIASSEAYDQRTVAEKWGSFLEALQELDGDSNYYRKFRAAKPTGKTHSWVVDYKARQTALIARLDTVLARGDAALRKSFQTMTSTDRQLLHSYGQIHGARSGGSIVELRASLSKIRRNLELDTLRLETDYEAVYLREMQIATTRRLASRQKEYRQLEAKNTGLQSQYSRLLREKRITTATMDQMVVDGAPPAELQRLQSKVDAIGAKLASLQSQIAALKPSLQAERKAWRDDQSLLREIKKPGSSSYLASQIHSRTMAERTALQMKTWVADALQRGARIEKQAEKNKTQKSLENRDFGATPLERVKAIIGFYETDTRGAIQRDSNGNPLLSQEMRVLSAALVADGKPAITHDMDLITAIGGEMTGTRLEGWANRLVEATADPVKNARLAPEVRAAAKQVETALREIAVARRFIAERNNTGTQMMARVKQERAALKGLGKKFAFFSKFESAIQSAMREARGASKDEGEAFLRVVEDKKYRHVWQLFKGYDARAVLDEVKDAELQRRVDEIGQLARRIRSIRREGMSAGLTAGYMKRLAAYQKDYASNALLASKRPTVAGYLDSQTGLKAHSLVQKIDALDAITDQAAFVNKLWDVLAAAETSEAYYASEAVGYIQASSLTGQALQIALVAHLKQQEADIRAGVLAQAAGPDELLEGRRDLAATESVAALMRAYANRKVYIVNKIQPVLNALVVPAGETAADLEKARTTVRTALTDQLGARAAGDPAPPRESAAYRNAARAMHRLVTKATSITEIKTKLSAYISGMQIESADALAVLGQESYQRELALALATAAKDVVYNKDDYIKELRSFVLIYQYNLAKDRLKAYKDARDSDVASIKDGARLNLQGVMGNFARWIVIEDFRKYQAEHNIASYMQTHADQRGIRQYIAEYLQDRKLSLARIPTAASALYEEIAVREYQRMAADAAQAGGVAALDERNYAPDFSAYILLAQFDAWWAARGQSLSGANATEQHKDFKTKIAAFLDHADYTRAGKSIRERLLYQDRIDRFISAAFAKTQAGTKLKSYLPVYLRKRATAGRLDDPLQTVAAELPDELKAISGWQTKTYKQAIAAVHPTYARELALHEVRAEFLLRSSDGRIKHDYESLRLPDRQLEAVIKAAGHSDLDAATRALLIKEMKAQIMQKYAARGAVLKDAENDGVTAAEMRERLTRLLRSETVLRHDYATQAEQKQLENLYASEGQRFASIEAKFFRELGQTDGRLREAAKNERGAFLNSLIHLMNGTKDGYYAALADQLTDYTPAARADAKIVLQAAMDQLALDFKARLQASHPVTGADTGQWAALNKRQAEYVQAFKLRSSQELVSSGIFEKLQREMQAAIIAKGDARLEAEYKANRASYLVDFIKETLAYQARADRKAIKAGTAPARTGKADAFRQALRGMDRGFLEYVQKEHVLLKRFADRYAEDEALREDILAVLQDPAVTDHKVQRAMDYASRMRLAGLAERKAELSAAAARSVAAHRRIMVRKANDLDQRTYTMGRLQLHARAVGDVALANRFAHYRTYIGMEKRYQDKAYQDYKKAIKTGDPQKSAIDFAGGLVLQAESLNIDVMTLFDKANWEERLKSDKLQTAKPVALGTKTADTTDDQKVQVKTVYRVADQNARNNRSESVEMRHTYLEHLANNYLEAISQLQSALNMVSHAATLARTREASTKKERLRDQMADKYDVHAAANTNDLSKWTIHKQELEGQLTKFNSSKIQQKQQQVDGNLANYKRAGDDFANAARRNHQKSLSLASYLNTVYRTVADDMRNKKKTFDDMSKQAEVQQRQYASLNRGYIQRMNEMAGVYRAYHKANAEYESATAVQEYASTPYLYAAGKRKAKAEQDYWKDHAADANDAYDLALQAYQKVQKTLEEAAFKVQMEEDLSDFATLLKKIEAGQPLGPLSADDYKEYLELQERKYKHSEELSTTEEKRRVELYYRMLNQRYGDYVIKRADYIKHTMRMVRIRKADEVINGRIRQLKGIVAEKKKAYERELAKNFGHASTPRDKKDRNAVYQRLAGQVETGTFNFALEFKSWYWAGGSWMHGLGKEAYRAHVAGGGLQITPSQIYEGKTGLATASMIPQADKDAIARWLGSGNGGMQQAVYNNFAGSYFGYVLARGRTDMAKTEQIIGTVAASAQAAIGATVLALGVSMVLAGSFAFAIGAGLVAMGQALMGAFIIPGAIAIATALIASGMVVAGTGWGTIIAGGLLTISGAAIIAQAASQIARLSAKTAMAKKLEMLMLGASLNAAETKPTADTMRKQAEYENAKAELEYFTKIDNIETLKERLVKYGRAPNHYDNSPDTLTKTKDSLYKLTDEDLKYLVETRRNRKGKAYVYAVDSNRKTQQLTTEEKNESLNVTNNKIEATFEDSFGRAYNGDPMTWFAYPPGPLVGGVYDAGSVKYTRIRIAGHDSKTSFRYAPIVAKGTTKRKAYHAGRIMEQLTAHGQTLRARRRTAYYKKGHAIAKVHGNRQFILTERDDTFRKLLQTAGQRDNGGREYSGYRMAYEDYEANQKAVLELELQQRTRLQLKEWDQRERELIDRRNAWETRIQAILERGSKDWSASEQALLNKRKDWLLDQDRIEAKARRSWADKVKEHQQKKKDWQDKIRQEASETSARAVLTKAVQDLNNQIISMNASTGLQMETLNKTAKINEALDEIRRSQPGSLERAQQLNKAIASYNTNLSLAQMKGTNIDISSLARDFSHEFRKHQKAMQLKNKVAIFEEYRKLLEDYKYQIKAQNEKIEYQTRGSALRAGFMILGDVYVKKVKGLATTGVVQKYQWFQTDYWFDHYLKQAGRDRQEEQDIVSFLKEKSDVEIDAYFHKQKLSVQYAVNKILGKARTEDERKLALRNKDKETLGAFGYWVGSAGDDTATSDWEQQQFMEGLPDNVQAHEVIGGAASALIGPFVKGGFGELGAGDKRPSGIAFGFYVQLQFYSSQWDKAQAKAGLSQSLYKSEGAMMQEGTAQVTKTVIQAAGAVAGAGAAAGLFGMGMSLINNMIQTDPVTGKVVFKSSDQAVINAFGGPLETAGAKYDEKGNLVRFAFEPGDLESAMIRMTAGRIAGYNPTAGALLKAAGEHVIAHNYGHDRANTTVIGTVQSGLSAYQSGIQMQREKDLNSRFSLSSNDIANEGGFGNLFRNIMAGGAQLIREDIPGMLASGFSLSMQLANGAISAGTAIWGAIKNTWESAGNWWNDRGWKTDNELKYEDAIAKQAFFLSDKGVSSLEELEDKFKRELFKNQTTGATNKFLEEAREAYALTKGMVDYTNEQRDRMRGNRLAIAQAQFGANSPQAQAIKAQLERQTGRSTGDASNGFYKESTYEYLKQQKRTEIRNDILKKRYKEVYASGKDGKEAQLKVMQSINAEVDAAFSSYMSSHKEDLMVQATFLDVDIKNANDKAKALSAHNKKGGYKTGDVFYVNGSKSIVVGTHHDGRIEVQLTEDAPGLNQNPWDTSQKVKRKHRVIIDPAAFSGGNHLDIGMRHLHSPLANFETQQDKLVQKLRAAERGYDQDMRNAYNAAHARGTAPGQLIYSLKADQNKIAINYNKEINQILAYSAMYKHATSQSERNAAKYVEFGGGVVLGSLAAVGLDVMGNDGMDLRYMNVNAHTNTESLAYDYERGNAIAAKAQWDAASGNGKYFNMGYATGYVGGTILSLGGGGPMAVRGITNAARFVKNIKSIKKFTTAANRIRHAGKAQGLNHGNYSTLKQIRTQMLKGPKRSSSFGNRFNRTPVTPPNSGYVHNVDNGLSPLQTNPHAGHRALPKENILPGGSGRALAGHGEHRLKDGYIIVPEGTTITRYGKHGGDMYPELAKIIESGKWDELRSNLRSSPVWRKALAGTKIYKPGDVMPNYRLLLPYEYGAKEQIQIFENSLTVNQPRTLKELLREDMGDLHWAACTWN